MPLIPVQKIKSSPITKNRIPSIIAIRVQATLMRHKEDKLINNDNLSTKLEYSIRSII